MRSISLVRSIKCGHSCIICIWDSVPVHVLQHEHSMFSRPGGKFPLTSNILHLYLNTAEHSFLLRDVMYLGWVYMLLAFPFDRMFVVFDLF